MTPYCPVQRGLMDAVRGAQRPARLGFDTPCKSPLPAEKDIPKEKSHLASNSGCVVHFKRGNTGTRVQPDHGQRLASETKTNLKKIRLLSAGVERTKMRSQGAGQLRQLRDADLQHLHPRDLRQPPRSGWLGNITSGCLVSTRLGCEGSKRLKTP